MADPFVGEIRMVGFNYAPRGWAVCDGQLLPISQNTALFSLLGTQYGGNGQTNFALPDLRGSVPMMWGQGPGLTSRSIGEVGGEANVTLTQAEMPAHSHGAFATAATVDRSSPAGNVPGGADRAPMYRGAADSALAADALAPAGSGGPHPNHQPSLALMFVIALQGVFPPRS